ncbi:MAG: signal peptide peptidase SppA, partial [Sphingomonadaceae bacterium]|nr:signal peptide peptidase SppA [Sphingomonadaceae bacterium]
LAEAAHRAGLVDRLGDRIAWGDRIAEIGGDDESHGPGGFQAIPLANWIAANPTRGTGGKIGVLTVAGTIVDGEAGPGTAGGETIAALMHQALADHELSALVVRIDSPGGSVLASEQIRRAVMQARARGIPVVISMGNLAASGGYWVATAGQTIFAEPSTITGSIGVFGIIPSFEGTLDQIGVGVDGVGTTPLSGEPDVLGGLSPEASALFQAAVEDVYRRFLISVARSRDMEVRRVDEIAQGRVWAGATARQLGLVDRFGSLDDAIAEAARLARLDPAEVQPVWIEQQPSTVAQFLESWFGTGEEQQASRDVWTRLHPSPRETLARVAAEARMILDGPALQARCLECPSDRPARLGASDASLLARLFAGVL